MKKIMTLAMTFAMAFSTSLALAQKASINDINTNEDTTISIKKGVNNLSNEKIYEIVEGQGDIEGDPSTLKNAARESWKKGCNDWKKEIKDMNKENQLLVLNCNAPQCSTETSSTICKSSGTYKMKVKVTK